MEKIFKSKKNTQAFATNQHFKKIKKTNFSLGIERINDITCYQRQPLMSVSRLLKPFFEVNSHNIPKHIMEGARTTGTSLMDNLEYFFKHNIKNLDEMAFATIDDRENFRTLMEYFIKHKISLVDVEKFIRTKSWCAYLDALIWVEGRGLILEIKTRSNTDIRQSDVVQCSFYRYMTDLPVLLLVLDKKTHKIKTYLFSSNRYSYSLNIPKKDKLVIEEMNRFLIKLGGKPLDKIDI